MESLSELENYALQHSLNFTTYNSGETVYSESEVMNGVFYLLDNNVKILKYDQNGKSVFLWYAKPKELFGLTSYFQEDGIYTCSAIVGENPCKIIHFTNDAFTSLLKQHSRLKYKVLRMFCNRIHFMEMRTRITNFESIDKRIIEILLLLSAKEYDDNFTNGQNNLRIYYSTKELAEMARSSLEYFEEKKRELKSKELIDYGKDWLQIIEVVKLKQMTRQ